jgi:hypothetical protein
MNQLPLKFCQKCRNHYSRDNFEIVPVKFGYRKDRICKPCRALKTYRAIVKRPRPAQFSERPEIRAKELALIPNPFTKRRQDISDNSHLSWSDCV